MILPAGVHFAEAKLIILHLAKCGIVNVVIGGETKKTKDGYPFKKIVINRKNPKFPWSNILDLLEEEQKTGKTTDISFYPFEVK